MALQYWRRDLLSSKIKQNSQHKALYCCERHVTVSVVRHDEKGKDDKASEKEDKTTQDGNRKTQIRQIGSAERKIVGEGKNKNDEQRHEKESSESCRFDENGKRECRRQGNAVTVSSDCRGRVNETILITVE